MKLLVVFILAGVGLSTQQSDNYCDPALCPYRGPHIACNGLTELASSCGAGAREIALTDTLQSHILYWHNHYRSLIAAGLLNNFPQASRMPRVFWDEELAEIAAANARRCVFDHDECRNTRQFPNAGQNLATGMKSGSANLEELIAEYVKMWFDEYHHADPSVISGSYHSGWTETIGHFIVMVSDKVTRIGCSLVSYPQGGWTQYLFVCNYSFTPMFYEPVYISGPACGGCQTGCSTYYKGMCHDNEIIS